MSLPSPTGSTAGIRKRDSQLLPVRADFYNLIDPLVLGHLEIVLLGNGRRYEAAESLVAAGGQGKRNHGTYRPPMKCRPLKNLTKGLGAVRLTKAVGLNVLPNPDFGGPSSIFQDDGASTAVTVSLVSSMALMTAGKGSRTSPEKLKPANDKRVVATRQLDTGTTNRILHRLCDRWIGLHPKNRQ